MMVKAMEVSGIEGNLRTTCEQTMSVLRRTRSPLPRCFDAFVHDPLINRRLMQTDDPTGCCGVSTSLIRMRGRRLIRSLTGARRANETLANPSQVRCPVVLRLTLLAIPVLRWPVWQRA
jgi:phosphatidylinositol kinase/protein kinase (PI-3  family)